MGGTINTQQPQPQPQQPATGKGPDASIGSGGMGGSTLPNTPAPAPVNTPQSTAVPQSVLDRYNAVNSQPQAQQTQVQQFQQQQQQAMQPAGGKGPQAAPAQNQANMNSANVPAGVLGRYNQVNQNYPGSQQMQAPPAQMQAPPAQMYNQYQQQQRFMQPQRRAPQQGYGALGGSSAMMGRGPQYADGGDVVAPGMSLLMMERK